MVTLPIALVIAAKIIIPSLMLLSPLLGIWGNYFFDIIDGDILLSLGLSDATYQTLDKSIDLFTYVLMLIVGLRWHIRKTVIILFCYRLVGQILYFISGNELIFFYFQNFLEPLLLIYTLLIFKNKSEDKAYEVYKKHWKIVWGIVFVYKIWNEWYLHFANIDLSLLIFGFTGGS